jgi:hypothetical protein
MQSTSGELPPSKTRVGSATRSTVTRRGGSARGSTTPQGVSTPDGIAIPAPGGSSVPRNSVSTPAIRRSLQGGETPSAVASSPPASDLPASDLPMASSPTPRRGLQNDGTPVPHVDARASITNPLQRKQGRLEQRQWSDSPSHPQAASTPLVRIVGDRSIHRFGHSDMTRMVNHTSRYVELYMWTKQPFMNGEELETVGFAPRAVCLWH